MSSSCKTYHGVDQIFNVYAISLFFTYLESSFIIERLRSGHGICIWKNVSYLSARKVYII